MSDGVIVLKKERKLHETVNNVAKRFTQAQCFPQIINAPAIRPAYAT